MSLVERFRAFLHPSGHPVRGSTVLLARLEAIEKAVETLQAREVAHDVAWQEAKDQISRHLKRASELARREDAEPVNGVARARDLVLKAKLNRGA